MSRALFVSDIHLTSERDANAALFLRFLDHCLKIVPEHLFLVGDIFDLWIADRKFFVSRFGEIIAKLERLNERGTQIHYFEGNHDLDLRIFWQHKLGFDVQDSAAFYKLYGRRLRVEHGDQMDPEDRGYLFLRWLLRTKFMRWMGRNLPDAVVKWIGTRASRASRGYTTNVKVASNKDVRAKMRAHSERVFPANPFDIIISGHVHLAEDSWHYVGTDRFRVINLGTWIKQPLVFDLSPERAELVSVQDFIQGK